MSVTQRPFMDNCFTNTGTLAALHCLTMLSTHSILQGRRFGPDSHPTTTHLSRP